MALFDTYYGKNQYTTIWCLLVGGHELHAPSLYVCTDTRLWTSSPTPSLTMKRVQYVNSLNAQRLYLYFSFCYLAIAVLIS